MSEDSFFLLRLTCIGLPWYTVDQGYVFLSLRLETLPWVVFITVLAGRNVELFLRCKSIQVWVVTRPYVCFFSGVWFHCGKSFWLTRCRADCYACALPQPPDYHRSSQRKVSGASCLTPGFLTNCWEPKILKSYHVCKIPNARSRTYFTVENQMQELPRGKKDRTKL